MTSCLTSDFLCVLISHNDKEQVTRNEHFWLSKLLFETILRNQNQRYKLTSMEKLNTSCSFILNLIDQ